MCGAMTLAVMIMFSKFILAIYAKSWKPTDNRGSSRRSGVWAIPCARNNVHPIALHLALYAYPRLDVDPLRRSALHISSAGYHEIAQTGPQPRCQQTGGSCPEIRKPSVSS